LTAVSGHERPLLDDAAAAAEAVAVGYEGAAARLGVSARTVRRKVAAGQLPAVRVGRRVVVPVAALEDMAKGAA
jgi:excisionase family DNA binding protein